MKKDEKEYFQKRGSQLIDNQCEFFSCKRVDLKSLDFTDKYKGFVNVYRNYKVPFHSQLTIYHFSKSLVNRMSTLPLSKCLKIN